MVRNIFLFLTLSLNSTILILIFMFGCVVVLNLENIEHYIIVKFKLINVIGENMGSFLQNCDVINIGLVVMSH